MTATTAPRTTAPARTRRAAHRAVWTLQVLVALFFVGASAAPKFFGESYAVATFEDIGAGQWFRYAVGVVELAGGIGLLVPRLAGAAAVGLMGLMVGAAYTQLAVMDAPPPLVTPVVLFLLCAVIAYARRHRITDVLPARLRS